MTARDVLSVPFAAHHGLVAPAPGAHVVLDAERGSGGFGVVYPLVEVDGVAPQRPTLAKIFDPDVLVNGGGPAAVVTTVSQLHSVLEASGAGCWPEALLALPYCLLTAQIDGEERLVALMLDLVPLGYVAAPFGDPATVLEYLRIPMRNRIEMAIRLGERLELLEQIRFLHADLNPPNLFVNLDTLDVQIIDFDAGVVVTTGAERPRAAGKPDDCLPPEIKGITPGAPPVDPARYDAFAERWAVGSTVGYTLFGFHPGFFLCDLSPVTVESYSQHLAAWPAIDTHGPLFTSIPVNQRAYARLHDELGAVPAAARDEFARFFAAGLDGAQRPTAADWLRALRELREPPRIELFEVGEEVVLVDDEVVVAWRAINATHVELSPGGRAAAEGSLRIRISAPVRIHLRAINAFGQVDAVGPVVRVVSPPRLDSVPIPAFPGLRVSTGDLTLAFPSDAAATTPAVRHFAGSFLSHEVPPSRLPSEPLIPPPPELSQLLGELGQVLPQPPRRRR